MNLCISLYSNPILAAPVLDEVNKIRPAHLLELALKNRVGEPAIDFTYTLADGKTGTLYNVKADLSFVILLQSGLSMPVKKLRNSCRVIR